MPCKSQDWVKRGVGTLTHQMMAYISQRDQAIAVTRAERDGCINDTWESIISYQLDVDDVYNQIGRKSNSGKSGTSFMDKIRVANAKEASAPAARSDGIAKLENQSPPRSDSAPRLKKKKSVECKERSPARERPD